jgi:hypothetical protein
LPKSPARFSTEIDGSVLITFAKDNCLPANDVNIAELQAAKLGSSHASIEHEEQESLIPLWIPGLLRRLKKALDLIFTEGLNLVGPVNRGTDRFDRGFLDVALGDEIPEEGTEDSVDIFDGPRPQGLVQLCDSVPATRLTVPDGCVVQKALDLQGSTGDGLLSAQPPEKVVKDVPASLCSEGRKLSILSVEDPAVAEFAEFLNVDWVGRKSRTLRSLCQLESPFCLLETERSG